ncbi:hypothetical protein [Spirillospora sp. CA-294931]|uniref:hypothetical protein n=1 Tax=Spirillospora sp. CA-294931 TaxID=3240042 RepID=UPI003D93696A
MSTRHTSQPAAQPATESAAQRAARPRRVVLYYQSHFGDDDEPISPLPLIEYGTGLTCLILAANHLHADGPVTVNDTKADDPQLDWMWRDLRTLQDHRVLVLGMTGGAAVGSYALLEQDFDTHYPKLRDFLTERGLDGIDLDLEEPMALPAMQKLITALRADFGDDFVITMAPVSFELGGGPGIAKFDYRTLCADLGDQIAWFNAQFYNNWGDLADVRWYDAILEAGIVTPDKLVAGTLTHPDNGPAGHVPIDQLTTNLQTLTTKHPDFGGVMGWEYYNSLPGDTTAPWQWAQRVSNAITTAPSATQPASGT